MHPYVKYGLERIALGLVFVVAWPSYYLLHSHQKHQRERNHVLRRPLGPRPRKFPRRRRALSIPARNHSQEQCRLLAKLPFEVRQMIWKECLGDNQFHLRVNDGQLSAIICSSVKPDGCYGPGVNKGCHVSGTRSPFDRNIFNGLTILRTCHAM